MIKRLIGRQIPRLLEGKEPRFGTVDKDTAQLVGDGADAFPSCSSSTASRKVSSWTSRRVIRCTGRIRGVKVGFDVADQCLGVGEGRPCRPERVAVAPLAEQEEAGGLGDGGPGEGCEGHGVGEEDNGCGRPVEAVFVKGFCWVAGEAEPGVCWCLGGVVK
jgi:hypothetical protein